MDLKGTLINSPAFQLCGMHLSMSFSVDRTGELWRSFMPRRKLVDSTDARVFSAQIFPTPFEYRADVSFEKWAAVLWTDQLETPPGMSVLNIPAGDYFVFHHTGGHANGAAIFHSIFNDILPANGYLVDDRPHFEILSDTYLAMKENAEEEIWIPVKDKK